MTENKLALILAFFISLFVMSVFLDGMVSADPLVEKINSVRSPDHQLYIDKKLNKMAWERCVKTKSWDHSLFLNVYSPKMKKLYQYQDENLALGQTTDQEVFEAWAASPGHRANMYGYSSRLYEEVGVGRCVYQNQKLTVLLIGGF